MPDRKPEPDPSYLTSDLPGTGGRLREQVTDFVVEELPLYEPSGAGEHLYLHIQKSGVSTHEAVRRVARALGVPAGKIGYAGLKDARALCRQTLSISGVPESRAAALDLPGISVLEVRRHRNKLRVGHLRGNRFVVRIRGVGPEATREATRVLERLAEGGVPNFFGAQRFGSRGDAHTVGKAILDGDAETAVRLLLGGPSDREGDPRLGEARRRFEADDLEGALQAFPKPYQAERRVLDALLRGRSPARALRAVPKGVFRIILSSYQSFLFNRLVRERMPGLGRIEEGDLAFLHDRGAVFSVLDPGEEQPRADRFEISPSAPLFGRKVLLAEGRPGARERAVLEAEGLTRESFQTPGAQLSGERRPVRVPVEEPRVRPDGEDAIVVTFALPRGSFATAALREITKTGDPGLEVPS